MRPCCRRTGSSTAAREGDAADLRRTTVRLRERADYSSALMPASLISLAYFAFSDLTYAASSAGAPLTASTPSEDRKSTRLNSSHPSTSYAVFCLKKQNP